MSYRSGHIYLVDAEPTNEELANFSKPVQFDVCKDGIFYSILYDKNGNRYVEDRSKITTGFIKLGTIVRVGNVINIGVHPSGFNHWRINGVDITSSNPATLELEPETNLYRIDSIVGNGAGGLFIFQGDANKNPSPLNPLNYPNYAFFKDVLITPNTGGSIDPEILNNYVSKEEESWKEITLGFSTNFTIDYSDERTRFKISSLGSAGYTLTGIIFSDNTERAVEFWVYNNTGNDITINNVATSGLTKGFQVYGGAFKIIANGKALLKYNPATDIIECWKDNSVGGNSGGISTVNTDSTLKGKGSTSEPLGLSEAKNAEIATKQDKSMFSALVDKWIHYYDSATAKMQPIIKLVTGAINQLEFDGRMKLAALILPPNSNPNVANRLWSDGKRVNFDNDIAVKNTLAYTSDLVEESILSTRVEITGSTTSGQTINLDMNAGRHFAITLQATSTLAITNMIPANKNTVFTVYITGAFLETLPSGAVGDPYNDTADLSKKRKYTFHIEKGGTTPIISYSLINV